MDPPHLISLCFDVDFLGFQNCLDVGLLWFSKIWLLFPQTFCFLATLNKINMAVEQFTFAL